LSVDEPSTLNVVARRAVEVYRRGKNPKTERTRVLFPFSVLDERRDAVCAFRFEQEKTKAGGERLRSRRFLFDKSYRRLGERT
jgi:hypothetical protein